MIFTRGINLHISLGITQLMCNYYLKRIFLYAGIKKKLRYKDLPMNTEKKNICTGILSIGDDTFKNQFGDIGKNLRNKRKKNKLS